MKAIILIFAVATWSLAGSALAKTSGDYIKVDYNIDKILKRLPQEDLLAVIYDDLSDNNNTKSKSMMTTDDLDVDDFKSEIEYASHLEQLALLTHDEKYADVYLNEADLFESDLKDTDEAIPEVKNIDYSSRLQLGAAGVLGAAIIVAPLAFLIRRKYFSPLPPVEGTFE